MWKLYGKIIQLQLYSLIEYRASFFFQLVGIIVGYMSTIILFWMIFQNFTNMGGWSFNQTILLYSFAITSINIADIFFGHFKSVDQEIVDGTFQRHLLRPYSALFSYMTSKFNIGEFSNLFISLAIFGWACSSNHLILEPMTFLHLIIGMIGAVSFNTALLIVVGSISFWTIRSENLHWTIVWPAQYLSYMPINIFPGLVRFLFSYIIPIVLIGSYPTSVLLGKFGTINPLVAMSGGMFVGLIVLGLSLLLWNMGIRKFEGTGS